MFVPLVELMLPSCTGQKGVHFNRHPFVVVEIGYRVPVFCNTQHLANILGDEPRLAVDQYGSDFVLAIVESRNECPDQRGLRRSSTIAAPC